MLAYKPTTCMGFATGSAPCKLQNALSLARNPLPSWSSKGCLPQHRIHTVTTFS